MILTPAQRRDYSVAVKNGTTANDNELDLYDDMISGSKGG